MTTTIIIFTSDNQPIGACESLTTRKREGKTKDNEEVVSVNLQVSRMRFSRLKLGEVFANNQFHVASQKYPVHISILENNIETTHIHNVWLMGAAAVFATDEWIVAEGIELEAEYIEEIRTVTQEA